MGQKTTKPQVQQASVAQVIKRKPKIKQEWAKVEKT